MANKTKQKKKVSLAIIAYLYIYNSKFVCLYVRYRNKTGDI